MWDGSTWNGWARAYFSKEQADELLRAYPELRGRYDPTGDRCIFPAHSEDPPYPHEADPSHTDTGFDPPDVYPCETVEVGGGVVKAYAIGSGSWVWRSG
ncbi:MAG: hypothetical protein KGJ23_15810 [Euryarchaeota archaeon]|nr:hypothetical protein [Euryarchaeota archaeon]MDE1838064.1 hypothetical protein [Euryarchaeota archaeon]MDE2046505.1 hypothetical protein [Thermoplasmata archaeon]